MLVILLRPGNFGLGQQPSGCEMQGLATGRHVSHAMLEGSGRFHQLLGQLHLLGSEFTMVPRAASYVKLPEIESFRSGNSHIHQGHLSLSSVTKA